MIDTHAHLNFKAFKDDADQVIKQSFEQGITSIINVGTNLTTSQQAIKIARNYQGCYAAIALHPTYVQDEEFNQEKYVSLITLNADTVKAIGETGLDFYHSSEDIDLQKQIFLQHLDLANDFDLPVIIHCRGSKEDSQDAYFELLKILKKFKNSTSKLKGTMHCFQSNWVLAEQFLS
ncbi:TatD family hydrolase [Patescibacteria group bacterium]|nr:TatD family hydrolase [Patescibacteria group bacterium]